MRASLIEKGIAQPVLPVAHFDQSDRTIPPPPPLPIPLPPPLPPPRKSAVSENVYHNEITDYPQIRDVDCQTTQSLQRPAKPQSLLVEHEIRQQSQLVQHEIRQQEITVYYDHAPFFERFCMYRGYNPKDVKPYPVTFEPSVMCIHDNDSKTYESIQPSNDSSSSTEELMSMDDVTCDEIKKYCCYYIFCCGICCD
ncbi:Hypothetical predicted protein [Mytilus galloprovincialis]|uniref:Uncharacterized protein n=1 Tax=Mytilus galloprovincialis TaxID=29158 RepID=A0A8B6GP69_MYTGA|nr:Hypothetical predicted protein [Mytilus galloprovincialis]